MNRGKDRIKQENRKEKEKLKKKKETMKEKNENKKIDERWVWVIWLTEYMNMNEDQWELDT